MIKKAETSALTAAVQPVYHLRLYTAGDEPNSRMARENLEQICREELDGLCNIEEINVLVDYESALRDRIFVTPTLVLLKPEPRTIVVGNLGNRDKVVSALHLGAGNG